MNRAELTTPQDKPPQQDVPVIIVRLTAPTDEALNLLNEYYEAIQVLQRDRPEDIRNLIAAPASGMWLAYLEDKPVGCVVLRSLPSIPRAGECKRLYVKPCARGRHIADRLMEAEEEYARSQGLEWLYLDTHDGLRAAIALYKRRGYQRCDRYNENPQATLFLRKYLGKR